ncbi:hypothetical protein QDW36_gp63 [Microbacterium phage Avocadoman]|uniref:hypothetical protein n=1 Tax=Microbacterium phage Avocadoman TaxID=2776864 RepID=UPI0018A66D2A|nr:hypothetical protein QDW36_gp63 [Microbacterium phage Avocadoman]QOP64891.1 hypothetical protein SEA_AVOCADOMAN_63 [Microbacterium phage Avocadoman]
MSTDFSYLAIGDRVMLTGRAWATDHGQGPNLIVTVDRFAGRQAWSEVDGVGGLTNTDGTPLTGGYEVELLTKPAEPAEPAEPAKPTAQGYTLSLYVSKSAAVEFPGETQELASITLNHDDLALLLRQGEGLLRVVADG